MPSAKIQTVATSDPWIFKARFRRNGFGWRSTKVAVERMNEAVDEIERVARVDPALGAEGAVLLLEKLSPAISLIDSSSGALGSAAAGVVAALVPVIFAAPVPLPVREKWLERLFEAIQEDDPPYIESLHEHWGALCGDADLASRWADRLLPLVAHVMADRMSGLYAYSQAETVCYSALFSAGRLDELTATLALDPRPYWHNQHWAAKALAARGDVDGAVALMEGLRGQNMPEGAIARVAEQLLLDAGRVDEAYTRFAIVATWAHTNIAKFRALGKRYPGVNLDRILNDLVASTPGEEGKWFATAKTLKRYELALALARRASVDPKTLIRAARDHVKSQPAFSLEVALLALYWMAHGAGYELTGVDVNAARSHALAAAEALGSKSTVDQRIAINVAGESQMAGWVRSCLGSKHIG